MTDEKCMCIKCNGERQKKMSLEERMTQPIRFACEICGNKRCPHHSDHELECTGSNEPGQPGSVY